MYKFLILLALPALILAQQHAMDFFDLIDADDDWELTHNEMDDFFREFDEDGNGRVSRQEFVNKIHTVVDWAVGHEQELYNSFDQNGDHHVDHTDFDIFFTQHDTNGDGLLSVTEYLTAGGN